MLLLQRTGEISSCQNNDDDPTDYNVQNARTQHCQPLVPNKLTDCHLSPTIFKGKKKITPPVFFLNCPQSFIFTDFEHLTLSGILSGPSHVSFSDQYYKTIQIGPRSLQNSKFIHSKACCIRVQSICCVPRDLRTYVNKFFVSLRQDVIL